MKNSYALATVATATMTMASSADIVQDIDVLFTVGFESDFIGKVVLSGVFAAEETETDGVFTLVFTGEGSFNVSDPGVDFAYEDLSVLLENDQLEGQGLASLLGENGEESFDFGLEGFGSSWDGSSASGIGLIGFNGFDGFTPGDEFSITWSIDLVPVPGVVALFGVAGLSRSRRRS
jgi:hypothetical protein